ncbi:MAG: ABC transporter substrate-binding protein [Planctomycetota bacterium]|jgi:ABC-type branched-subunit amino acid transport system substrate-binding protein|nr:ABC transporter substrate-binding protein [Planctomycetota bacterium]
MRRSVALLISLVLVLVAWWLWWPRTVVVGVVISSETALGTEANLAVRVYRDLRPDFGDGQVRLEIRQTSRDPDALRQAYREVVDAGAVVVLGGMLSQTAMVLAECAAETGVPCIGVTASTADLSGRRDGFFRTMMDTEQVGRVAAQHLQGAGYKRPLCIAGTANAAYTRAEAGSVARHGDGKIINEADLEADWSEVLAYRPDVIYLAMAPVDGYRFIKAARERCPGVALYGSEWTSSIVDGVTGPEVEGLLVVTRRAPLDPAFDDLAETLSRRHGRSQGIAAAYMWSALELVDSLLDEGAGAGPDRMWQALGHEREVRTNYGMVRLDRNGDAWQRELALYQVQDGQLVYREAIAADSGQ